MLWLAAGLALLTLLALLVALSYFVPVSLSCNLQVRAEPSGTWAAAWGLALGPVAVSAIAAAGLTPFMTCHLFGRQLVRLPLSGWMGRKPAPTSEPAATPRTTRAVLAVARLFRGLDPVEMLLSWWDKERVFQVRSVVVDLDYSFRDVALTGRILAALCVLSALLPEQWELNQTPSWGSEDRVLLATDGRFRIWLGRLLFYVVRFVLRQSARLRQSAVAASE